MPAAAAPPPFEIELASRALVRFHLDERNVVERLISLPASDFDVEPAGKALQTTARLAFSLSDILRGSGLQLIAVEHLETALWLNGERHRLSAENEQLRRQLREAYGQLEQRTPAPPIQIDVHVPEQPAPVVNIENHLDMPARSITVDRDAQGWIKGAKVEAA